MCAITTFGKLSFGASSQASKQTCYKPALRSILNSERAEWQFGDTVRVQSSCRMSLGKYACYARSRAVVPNSPQMECL